MPEVPPTKAAEATVAGLTLKPLVLPVRDPVDTYKGKKRRVYLKPPDRKAVGEFYAAGFGAGEIAKAFNINFTTVYKIIKDLKIPKRGDFGRRRKAVDTF